MSKLRIEFFHDVICSYCFPMSYRMRQIKAMMPDLEIIHRSYAFIKSEHDFDLEFGSRSAAKNEILGHWVHANQNDDLHRFNIEGMKKADFPFPTSMKPLIASKAAYFSAGDDGYWDVFDSLQKALFVLNQNIEDDKVIEECVKRTGIDFDKWQQYYDSKETINAVDRDLLLAEKYNIQSVPCLIINGKYQISGALPLNRIVRTLKTLMESPEQDNSDRNN